MDRLCYIAQHFRGTMPSTPSTRAAALSASSPSFGPDPTERPLILVSVSGQLSRAVGKQIAEFAREVVPDEFDVWYYSDDIRPGQNGFKAIKAALLRCVASISIHTRTNCQAPWLVWEAGFLSGKSLARGINPLILPVLVDVHPLLIAPPLDSPQAVQLSESGLRRVFETIGQLAGHGPGRTGVRFDKNWPRLRRALMNIVPPEFATYSFTGSWKYDAREWRGSCRFDVTGIELQLPTWHLRGKRQWQKDTGRLKTPLVWRAEHVFCDEDHVAFRYTIRRCDGAMSHGFAYLIVADRDEHQRPTLLEGDLTHVSPTKEVTRLQMRRCA